MGEIFTEGIKIGNYGQRDGIFFAKKLRVQDKIPMELTIADAAATGTASILSSKNMHTKGTAAYVVGSLVAQPDFARNIIVSANTGGVGSAGEVDEVLIAGYTANGNYQEEKVVISSTAEGTTGSNNCFSKITSITPKTTTASNAVKATSVSVGFGDHIGLPYPIDDTSDILTFAVGGVVSSATMVMATVNSTYDKLTGVEITTAENYVVRYKTKLM